MPELYNTCHPYNKRVNIAYYSEREWLSFFLNFLLPQRPLEYLSFFENGRESKPFLLIDEAINFVIFNRIDLGGKTGFGVADGGIYFETKKKNYFIFIQAINKIYMEGCNIPEKSKLDFHKSINGRLELNYRFTLALKYALNKQSVDKIISEKLFYLHESYIKTDKFYIIPGKKFDDKKARKMKVNKEEATENSMGIFFNESTEFYYLTVTTDMGNPLSPGHSDYYKHYTPRIYPEKDSQDMWEIEKDFFLWIPKYLITDKIRPELSDFRYSSEEKFCYYYPGLKEFSPEKVAFECREETPKIYPASYSRLDFLSF